MKSLLNFVCCLWLCQLENLLMHSKTSCLLFVSHPNLEWLHHQFVMCNLYLGLGP